MRILGLVISISLLLSSCSETVSSVSSEKADIRASQMAFDMQQLAVQFGKNPNIGDEELNGLNLLIDTYQQDFVDQSGRLANDESFSALDHAKVKDISQDIDKQVAKLTSMVFSQKKIDRNAFNSNFPSVPIAIKELIFPLVENTQQLYLLVDNPDRQIKPIVKRIEQQSDIIRSKTAQLDSRLASNLLVITDVVEAIIWAAEPAYIGRNLAAQAALDSDFVLTRGSSDSGDCSSVSSIFKNIVKRIPNVLVSAIQGALSAVNENKASGDVLKAALVGAANGFTKDPEKSQPATAPAT